MLTSGNPCSLGARPRSAPGPCSLGARPRSASGRAPWPLPDQQFCLWEASRPAILLVGGLPTSNSACGRAPGSCPLAALLGRGFRHRPESPKPGRLLRRFRPLAGFWAAMGCLGNAGSTFWRRGGTGKIGQLVAAQWQLAFWPFARAFGLADLGLGAAWSCAALPRSCRPPARPCSLVALTVRSTNPD